MADLHGHENDDDDPGAREPEYNSRLSGADRRVEQLYVGTWSGSGTSVVTPPGDSHFKNEADSCSVVRAK